MARAFIIDTDTASDDAVALIMALRWPEVDVKAITMVAGNVGLDQATRNALYTVGLTGKRVPVYMGARKPLTRTHECPMVSWAGWSRRSRLSASHTKGREQTGSGRDY